MLKTELVEAVAETTGYSKKNVQVVLNALVDQVTAELKSGGAVQVTGFGTFSVKPFASRKVTSPFGDVYKIPKHTVPHFKAGEKLKEAVYKTKC